VSLLLLLLPLRQPRSCSSCCCSCCCVPRLMLRLRLGRWRAQHMCGAVNNNVDRHNAIVLLLQD
jgi:hypothetical protein